MTLSTETAALVPLDHVDSDVIWGPAQTKQLMRCLDELAQKQVLGIDTETTGLDPRTNRVRLIQIGTENFVLIVDLDGWRIGGKRYVDWDIPVLKKLKDIIGNPTIKKVLQNAAFDLNFLRAEGVLIRGHIHDTMIADYIVNNGTGSKNDLGSIVRRRLNVELPKDLQKADWSGTITEEMVQYAARDVAALLRLVPVQREKLASSRVAVNVDVSLLDVFKLEMEALRPIAAMRWHGFGFDVVAAHALQKELEAKEADLKMTFLEELDAQLRRMHPEVSAAWLPKEADGSFNTREKDKGSIRLGTKVYAGFNPRSPQQMAEKFQKVGIILPPDEKGKPCLDQNLLAFIRAEYSLIRQYLEWKNAATRVSHVEKLRSSVGPTGRIHCDYRQSGTETGRLSAAKPNLQQVPREASFRSLFVPASGNELVVADFSQIELRVAAELSGEPRMIEAYAQGRDLHIETAMLLTGKAMDQITKAERQSAKIANFGLLFGAGAATLQKQAVSQYGVDMSLAEARVIVEGFRDAYPVLHQWQLNEGESKSIAVFTRYGRRRMLKGTFNDKFTTRINTQVQGTAGDISKIAMAILWKCLESTSGGEAKLIAMVHDEIVMEVRSDVAELWAGVLKGAMEEAGSIVCHRVPIVAEVSRGINWAEAK